MSTQGLFGRSRKLFGNTECQHTDALWISLKEDEDDVTDSTDSLEEEEEDDSLGDRKVTGAPYISPAARYQGPDIGGLPSDTLCDGKTAG